MDSESTDRCTSGSHAVGSHPGGRERGGVVFPTDRRLLGVFGFYDINEVTVRP